MALASWLGTGAASERGTEGMAAWWKITSTPSAAFAIVAGSRMSPSIHSMSAPEIGQVLPLSGR